MIPEPRKRGAAFSGIGWLEGETKRKETCQSEVSVSPVRMRLGSCSRNRSKTRANREAWLHGKESHYSK